MFGTEDFEGKLICALKNDMTKFGKFAWAEINE